MFKFRLSKCLAITSHDVGDLKYCLIDSLMWKISRCRREATPRGRQGTQGLHRPEGAQLDQQYIFSEYRCYVVLREWREGKARTGNPLCVRRGREGAQYTTYLVKLRGRGREGAKTPISYAALPNTPNSVQAGMDRSVRGTRRDDQSAGV